MKKIRLLLILAIVAIVIIIFSYFKEWLAPAAILSNLLFGLTASILSLIHI